jgi:co-chaperonin GroES (HSP10)
MHPISRKNIKLNPRNVEPGAGKYWVRINLPEDKTEGGLHLPKLTDERGVPVTSVVTIPTAEIVAVGPPTAPGTPNEVKALYSPGDTVILGAMNNPTMLEGGAYTLLDFYHIIGRITDAD